MKLFFYNRTSLSNVIIRKYFVCDISLDSIPQSCKSIFSNSPRKQLLLYFLVRQQATARQSNTWSSSSNMSDPDDSNIWILRIQTALSRWGAPHPGQHTGSREGVLTWKCWTPVSTPISSSGWLSGDCLFLNNIKLLPRLVQFLISGCRAGMNAAFFIGFSLGINKVVKVVLSKYYV